MVSSRSACPYSPQIGFMRTHFSRPPKSSASSQPRTTGRVATFRSGATASSRSRMSPSAGSARAFCIIRSLPPGTKWSDRRRAPTSGLRRRHGPGPEPAHHGRAPAAHDEIAVLVPGAVLEGDDSPFGPRARLALLDDLRLRVDGVAVEHRTRELDLL